MTFLTDSLFFWAMREDNGFMHATHLLTRADSNQTIEAGKQPAI